MPMIDLAIPQLNGLDFSDEKVVRKLTSYLYKLDEQLRYVLSNLGEDNLSDSLRTVINTKSDATVINELTGRLQRLNTQIIQTAEKILLKADKAELDALGDELEKSVAEFEVTAEQIRSEVSSGDSALRSEIQQTAEAIRSEVEDTEEGLQSQINQQAGQITLSVQTANSAAAAASNAQNTANNAQATANGKLDADAPSVGVETKSGVTINENGVYVEGKEIDLRTSDGDDYVNISESGVSASRIDAPNVAVRYDGGSWIGVNPKYTAAEIAMGNRYRSLGEAFDSLRNKVVENNLTIQILSGSVLYENASLAGVRFLNDCTITTSDGPATASIYGSVTIRYCEGYIKMEYIKFYPADGQRAITAFGKAEFLHLVHCYLYGQAKTTGTYATGCLISDGAGCQAVYCEFYNFSYAMEVASLASLNVQSGNKGNCNLYVRKAFLFVTGAAPSENASEWRYTYNGAHFCNTYNVSVDQGSASGTVAPSMSTLTLLATNTGSYAGSGSRFRSEVGQGWYSGIGRIRGCMWFNASSISGLSGRTILSATLRLSMRKGVGRGASVTVELCGTAAAAGASSAAVTKSYGVIGTTSPGEVTTITIPNQAVTDLVGGTIRGLMLYSSDTGAYKDRSYSKNYALFDGNDSGDIEEPMLTVVYR